MTTSVTEGRSEGSPHESFYSLSTSWGLGVVVSVLQILSHIRVLTSTLLGRYYYYLHFIDEVIEP